LVISSRSFSHLYDGTPKKAAVGTVTKAQLNTGKHQKPWFPFGHDAYSKPLSDTEPDKTQFAFVPACAVFTFDNAQKISNLAIYMDRWQMAVDLWPGTSAGKKPGRHFPAP
jgi:hypothetical protein